MEFVDTHCHPFFPKLLNDLESVLDRAKDANVNKIIAVGTSLDDSEQTLKIAAAHNNIWASVGVHPHEAEEFLEAPHRREKMFGLLAQSKVVAIGEIGLDYYKSQTPRLDQEKALRAQIDIGLPTGLPFIFHVRDGWSDFWRIFDEYDNLTGVIHSFSSGVKQLNAALNRGLYIGLNGIMTFTKDQAQLEAARQVPLDKLLLETDAPFLTPAPLRDEVCEPRHTAVTAKFLAQLRGESIEDLAKATTANAEKLFKI
jgi:TatD DNase family protein